MNYAHILKISREQALTENQVRSVAELLEQGATVPFIARYRKEATGSLDEVAITAVRDRLAQLDELDSRRAAILKSMEQHGHLTEALKAEVGGAETLAVLEDIYLPYRPKRRTKATIAREKGLEPLALQILEQTGADPRQAAGAFVDAEKGVASPEDALEGARHIIAERISEDPRARAELREFFSARGTFRSTVVADMEEAGAKYRDYFDWEEPIATAPSHRILAMRRGEKEDVLNLNIAPPEEEARERLRRRFLKGDGEDAVQVDLAVRDSYKRLLSRSMETEMRLMTRERADAEAIRVFAENLRELLLAPPLGARRVMGVDPGFRTGCKIVCLDRQGKLIHSNETLYLHQPEKSAELVKRLCGEFGVEAVAIGNGTASRETEAFFRGIGLPETVQIVVVSESGASVYSASAVAREEFPDLDLTVRGAVSIARRLMDPLAELVKIDPKSIGVGQYQHDVDQPALKQALDDVVVSCVNGVGVDVNRASAQLLTYVSGLGPQLAKNIVACRDENGPFISRKGLKSVRRLGPKAFEQCAGFLRIQDGDDPLDASAVHPESYHIVQQMAKDLDCTVSDLMRQDALRRQIEISAYVTDTVGLPTLRDILAELARPGRDPRQQFEAFSFAGGIEKITDLEAGMRLPGIVTNVTAFGAFVDVGVHQDGLVHISELADRFVKNPADVVRVQQKVRVRVLDVDLGRNRISLSMRSAPAEPAPDRQPSPQPRKPKKQKKKGARNQPFNNPFADLMGKIK
ncbi:RNA-binding transcriptional accessory protein [Desulfonema ishimotonii]|uniref:RNA-binding transcriptional accessory protein n=1 Tax=Desulfonema ishimotonii TaxID=45657 RepID=A0A401FRM0_9BACT|nr:Tex family protein [Desulfonema ishimotonii]GBC59608.1 RNA-binding transcriptional accessory protein [Desulfonema ishimotonii]